MLYQEMVNSIDQMGRCVPQNCYTVRALLIVHRIYILQAPDKKLVPAWQRLGLHLSNLTSCDKVWDTRVEKIYDRMSNRLCEFSDKS